MRAQVLEAKLRQPTLPRHVVPLTRLDAALDTSTARLVIVHAKAGAGKTTALTRFAQRSAARVAWCSLDRADNDPDRFWAHVVAAIDHGIGDEALDLLDEGYGADAVGASLVADLQRLPVPIVLVLDDLHLVAEPYVYDTLDVVVRYAPPHIRIVLAGREQPRLDAIETTRVRGDLLEIDDASLRMTYEDAEATLERVVGEPLAAVDVATLVERTEGWAGGIALAGISLRDVKDRSRAIAHFGGSDRPVAEYLTHEVLDRQPPHIVRFLLDTSVLHRLDADICQVVTERADAAALLREIERRALFITPTDEPPGSYRYDPLFRELLEDALRRTDPARHRTVHFRAAVWCQEHGRPAAFEHWLEAGELDRAWELFHAHAVSRLFAGGRSTVARWTTLLPDRTPAIDAGRAIDLALALLYLADMRSAESWMGHATDLLSRSDGVPVETAARFAYARFLFDFARGEYHEARAHGDHAHALFDRASPPMWGQLRGSVVYVRVASILGDFDAADEMYARATREVPARGPVDRVVLPTAACELELRKGNLGLALGLAARALEAAAALAGPLDPITADAHFVAGAVLLERNDVPRAEWRLRTAMQLGESSGFIHSWVCPALWLAHAWHLLGRGGDAWTLLEDIRQHRGRAAPRVLAQRIEATSARLALFEGDLERARAHAALSDEPRRLRLVARIHAEAGESELALAASAQVVARGLRDRIDGLLVLARCAPTEGRRAAALREALTVAERDGFVRVFVDEARWITEPLRELVAIWPTPYVADLVTALANEPARSPRAGGALTEREVEVWRYLSTPLSTREIADALFISRNTLKSHLRSIYRKLAVTTRHDAVSRGEERIGRQPPGHRRQSPRVG